MVVGSDFDGVIADTFSLAADGMPRDAIVDGAVDIRCIRPLSARMVDLLNSNRIGAVITARDTLTHVYQWISYHAPGFKGVIQSSKVWNDSKAIACIAHGIDIFIDDDPTWVEEINNAGLFVLHFDRKIHSDPGLLLSEAVESKGVHE